MLDKEILDILKVINGKFDNLESRFDNLESRFDGLEGRFDRLEKKVDKLEEGQEQIVLRLDKVEVGLSNLEKGQEELKSKLDYLSEDMTRELSNVAAKVSDIEEVAIKNAQKIAELDMQVTKLKVMH